MKFSREDLSNNVLKTYNEIRFLRKLKKKPKKVEKWFDVEEYRIVPFRFSRFSQEIIIKMNLKIHFRTLKAK